MTRFDRIVATPAVAAALAAVAWLAAAPLSSGSPLPAVPETTLRQVIMCGTRHVTLATEQAGLAAGVACEAALAGRRVRQVGA